MSFLLSVALPFDRVHLGREFVSMDAVRACATAAEDAGFWSGTIADHPAPSSRLLNSDGHHSQDPFVVLSMVATVTTRLRVQSDVIVLPYRNPFITARAVSSLDAFSGGRVVLGLGAGYLKPEFKALGVPFDRRNDLMDEYIRAMKLAWTGEDFSFEGTGYAAVGNRVLPTPVQQPHPPLLIGGNSKRALRRAVEYGDAWHPFIMPKNTTDTARTPNIASDNDLLRSIRFLVDHSEKLGRSVPPTVLCSNTYSLALGFNAQDAIDHFSHLRTLGVAGSGVTVEANSRSQWCDLVRQFGEEVISRIT